MRTGLWFSQIWLIGCLLGECKQRARNDVVIGDDDGKAANTVYRVSRMSGFPSHTLTWCRYCPYVASCLLAPARTSIHLHTRDILKVCQRWVSSTSETRLLPQIQPQPPVPITARRRPASLAARMSMVVLEHGIRALPSVLGSRLLLSTLSPWPFWARSDWASILLTRRRAAASLVSLIYNI